jgi:hypothetical protein
MSNLILSQKKITSQGLLCDEVKRTVEAMNAKIHEEDAGELFESKWLQIKKSNEKDRMIVLQTDGLFLWSTLQIEHEEKMEYMQWSFYFKCMEMENADWQSRFSRREEPEKTNSIPQQARRNVGWVDR